MRLFRLGYLLLGAHDIKSESDGSLLAEDWLPVRGDQATLL